MDRDRILGQPNSLIMPRDLSNPHDVFMKSILSDIDMARDFLLNFLPTALQQQIDISTLKAEKSSFISQDLQELFSDALLQAALLTQKFSHNPEELSRRFQQIFQTVTQARGKNFLKEIAVYYFSIVEISPTQLFQLLKPLPLSLNIEIMSTYDMILQEGIEKGIEKGIEMEKAEILIRGYQNGIPVETLCLITGLSREEVDRILSGEEDPNHSQEVDA